MCSCVSLGAPCPPMCVYYSPDGHSSALTAQPLHIHRRVITGAGLPRTASIISHSILKDCYLSRLSFSGGLLIKLCFILWKVLHSCVLSGAQYPHSSGSMSKGFSISVTDENVCCAGWGWHWSLNSACYPWYVKSEYWIYIALLKTFTVLSQKAQVTETFEAIFTRCVESIVEGTKR